MATQNELFASTIFLKAALPLTKVILEYRPKMAAKYKGLNGVVQFIAKDEAGDIGAFLQFTDGVLDVKYGIHEHPDIVFTFKSVKAMNDFFAGKPAVPSVKGLTKLKLLIKSVNLLLALKIIGRKTPPKKPEDRELMVRLLLYLLPLGISQLNKAGYPDIAKFCQKSPDRTFAWSVTGTDIASYLRMKAGNSKSGRGRYTRSKPFVEFKFDSIDGALGILLQTTDMMEASLNRVLVIEGSPEYGKEIGSFMNIVGQLAS